MHPDNDMYQENIFSESNHREIFDTGAFVQVFLSGDFLP